MSESETAHIELGDRVLAALDHENPPASELGPMTWADLDHGRHTEPVDLDEHGNCLLCGEHPMTHIRNGEVIPPRTFHAADAAETTEDPNP